MTSGSVPTAPATTSSSAPTSTAPTPVDPASYAAAGGEKYLFGIPGGYNHCWIHLSVSGSAMPTSIDCVLEFAPGTAPVYDKTLEETAVPAGVVIDGDGSYAIAHVLSPDVPPLEVPVGSSITVSNMTCEVPAENAVRCAAQTGEFSFADGAVQILRSEPSPYKAAGAGKVCPEVDAPGGPAPVIILAGKLSCDTAASVIEKYFAMPVDPMGGNTNPQEFDGFYCAAPTAARAEELGIGVDCEGDGIRVILPYP